MEVFLGIGEMAQGSECSLCDHKDQSSNPEHPHESWCGPTCS